MPHIVHGNNRSGFNSLKGMNYDYEYPEGLDLKPGSKLHDSIRDKIWERAQLSASVMTTRHKSWNKIDEVLTTYTDLNEDDLEALAEDSKKPVTIVFPYSYAILETVVGYLLSAFLQNPIFEYIGKSGEDTIGAILMTQVIQQQCEKAKVGLAFHTMFRDSLSYGFGVVTPSWKRTVVQRPVIQEDPGFFSSMFGGLIGGGKTRGTEDHVLFEGNTLLNINPYYVLPDTNVPIDRLQDGEFFGWVEYDNYMNMLSEEKNEDNIFNVKYLKGLSAYNTSVMTDDPSAREKRFGGSSKNKLESVTTEVGKINMYVKLIPKEWKLGDGEYPEKWFFTLSADNIITRAEPLGLNHDMFPVASCAPDYDGYSTTPVSRIETLQGLQTNLDFLFNMHMYNVRKAVNDMFVVDPYSLNTNDIKNPKPGKLIRTRRPVWGKGVKDSIMQLQVNDITRANIQDSGWIVQWMQKIGGADDAAMGSLRQGGPERLTGQEFQGTKAGAFNRLERMAKVIGMQAMQDIGYMFASHSQQLLEEPQWAKAIGTNKERLLKEFGGESQKQVMPEDMLIDYDLVVRDGSIPGSNYSPVWEKMFDTIAQHPELNQKFDIQRIATHIMRNNGAQNVDEFLKVEIAPDEQALNMAADANMRPTNQAIPQAGGQV
ncbi:MAG: hypothetical protein DRP62_05930 [Planctomycetota bacterium]|nr:MAG: hypothetical protein DRP62_05930 [Planctomycetota bacterium]